MMSTFDRSSTILVESPAVSSVVVISLLSGTRSISFVERKDGCEIGTDFVERNAMGDVDFLLLCGDITYDISCADQG